LCGATTRTGILRTCVVARGRVLRGVTAPLVGFQDSVCLERNVTTM